MKMSNPLRIRLGIGLAGILMLTGGLADEDARFIRVQNALHKFTLLFHQQKVYLHLDRNIYFGGDDMWIKAYVMNGTDHLPDTTSTNLYVEIIGPLRSRVFIKRFQLFSGFGTGDFHLPDTLPEGLYQIRAYTAWMQNFNSEYYFEKNFQLINHNYRKYISPRQARINSNEIRKLSKDTVEVDLQFMPEGGDLVEQIESVVGFKAVNRLGKGVDLEGIVYDDKGNQITTFKSQHKGIGRFTITPMRGKKYVAVARLGKKELKVPLPHALEQGIVMHVEHQKDHIVARFVSNRPQTKDPTMNEIIVVGQVGGIIYYNKIIQLEEGKAEVEIPRIAFPGGVMQLTAFSGRGIPIAERLVVMTLKGIMRIAFSAYDSLTDEGTKVALKIRTRDVANTPLRANLSLTVTKEFELPFDTNEDNIVSNLLISSDLTGHVEDPLAYLREGVLADSEILDNLMLTQGWRRFNWNELLAGKYPVIRYPEEKGITVSGKVTREFFGRPLRNAKVQLSVMTEYNDVFTANTNEKGIFQFENLVYFDTVSVKIEARKANGRKNLVILLQNEKINELNHYLGEAPLTTLSERNNKGYRIDQNNQFKKDFEEAEKARKEENRIEGFYGDADHVLYAKDFHTSSGNIFDVIRGRVPGVQVNGNSVQIRGPNTITGNTQPLYLLDGVPLQDSRVIADIPIEDIERVEFLKGPSASFYGSRGANGVIAVYTKRGQFLIKGKLEFDMLGYSAPRQFYQPKYTVQQEPLKNYTLIWVPVIITNDKGLATVVFDKPEFQGNFHFSIQGLSYFGHPGYTEALISNQ